MKSPSPAFSLYPKDVLSDEDCDAMTHEEMGIHFRLILHAWLEGSIPKDHKKLGRMLKINHAKLRKVWPAIEPCWTPLPGDDSRLIQSRLEVERERQVQRSAHQSVRGQKGGRPIKSTNQQTREKAGTKPDETPVIPGKSLASPSPFPSPSPTTDKRKQSSVAVAPGRDSWSRAACDDWIARHGGTAPGGRIGKALSPLVKRQGWPEVRGYWRQYLGETEAEYASPERFAATYNRWSGNGDTGKGPELSPLTQHNMRSLGLVPTGSRQKRLSDGDDEL